MYTCDGCNLNATLLILFAWIYGIRAKATKLPFLLTTMTTPETMKTHCKRITNVFCSKKAEKMLFQIVAMKRRRKKKHFYKNRQSNHFANDGEQMLAPFFNDHVIRVYLCRQSSRLFETLVSNMLSNPFAASNNKTQFILRKKHSFRQIVRDSSKFVNIFGPASVQKWALKSCNWTLMVYHLVVCAHTHIFMIELDTISGFEFEMDLTL